MVGHGFVVAYLEGDPARAVGHDRHALGDGLRDLDGLDRLGHPHSHLRCLSLSAHLDLEPLAVAELQRADSPAEHHVEDLFWGKSCSRAVGVWWFGH